jgi:hypothetical protein
MDIQVGCCGCLLVIVHSAARNIHVQLCVWVCLFSPLGAPTVELLGHTQKLCLTSQGAAHLSSIYLPNRGGDFQLPQILHSTYYFPSLFLYLS